MTKAVSRCTLADETKRQKKLFLYLLFITSFLFLNSILHLKININKDLKKHLIRYF